MRTIAPLAAAALLVACGTEAPTDSRDTGPQVQQATADVVQQPGAVDLPITDSFSAGEGQQLDIVLHVDSSPTTEEARERLTDDIFTLLSPLTAGGVDWRLLILTDASGCNDLGVLTWRTPTLAAGLEAALTATTDEGSDVGLHAVSQALQSTFDGCNEGLLRPQAPLHVLTLSDRDDASPMAWTQYADDLRRLRLNVASISAIAPTDACSVPTPRINEIVDHTMGVRVDLCEDDWTDALLDIAGVAGSQLTFDLSETADPATITVTVDGVPHETWNFDPRLNVLQVWDDSPTLGAAVEVTYATTGS